MGGIIVFIVAWKRLKIIILFVFSITKFEFRFVKNPAFVYEKKRRKRKSCRHPAKRNKRDGLFHWKCSTSV